MDTEETNGDTNIGEYSYFERNLNFLGFTKVNLKKSFLAGSLRAIILELRNDIGSLSKSFQDKKDDEMAIMNELKQANANLVTNRVNLEKKIEDQTATIIALQKGINANTNLNEKYKCDLAASLESNEKLKIEVERFGRKLTEAENNVASKLKVVDELASLKSKSDSVVAELQEEIVANTSLFEKYKSDLTASLESNEQLQIEVERLGRKLTEAEKSIASNKKVKDELASLKSNSDGIVAELQFSIQSLVQVNSESAKENEQLKLELKQQAARNQSDVANQTGEVRLVSVFYVQLNQSGTTFGKTLFQFFQKFEENFKNFYSKLKK